MAVAFLESTAVSDLIDLLLDPSADHVVALDDEAIHPDEVGQELRERGVFAATIYLQAATRTRSSRGSSARRSASLRPTA